LHIIATAQTESRAEAMVSKDERLLRNLLTDLIYGEDEQTLAEVVGEKLAQKNKTVAVAESCTGGILAKLITDVAGASRYFTFGWVTYSNTAKISELGVPADLIEKYGAVSEEVARSMAKCARKKAGADYAIGITGIAGPTGGSRTKPVGLVYICVDSDGKSEVKRNVFAGSRGSVRLRAARTALKMLGMQLSI
jgi:nicotinamide-nucleotide amidase